MPRIYPFTLVPLAPIFLLQYTSSTMVLEPWVHRCSVVVDYSTDNLVTLIRYEFLCCLCPLHKETSLLRSDNYVHLWVRRNDFRGFDTIFIQQNSNCFIPGVFEHPSHDCLVRLTKHVSICGDGLKSSHNTAFALLLHPWTCLFMLGLLLKVTEFTAG